MTIATIIGGQGFIGRHLQAYLQSLGWQVWVPAKDDSELLQRELGNVFYCAGLTADYLQRPFDTVDAHVSNLNRILYFAKWERLVYLSSTRVYDGLVGVVNEMQPLILNPNNPRHLYDLSKLLGESMCLQTGRASVARLACVYKDDRDSDGFLPDLMRQALACNQRQLMLDSSPHFARDYVHLNDVMIGLLAIMGHSESKIYNVASGENVSNASLFGLIEKECGIEIMPNKSDCPLASPSLSIDRMAHDFGWKPGTVLSEVKKILNARFKER